MRRSFALACNLAEVTANACTPSKRCFRPQGISWGQCRYEAQRTRQ